MSSDSQPVIKVPFPPNITIAECINIPRGGRIPTRPPNCFIIYRRVFQKALHEDGHKFQINKVSAMASESWQRESAQVKKYYKVLSGKANRHLITLREKETMQNKNKSLLSPPIVPSQHPHGASMFPHSSTWPSQASDEASNLQQMPQTPWNNYSNNYATSTTLYQGMSGPNLLLDTTYSQQDTNFSMFFDQNEHHQHQPHQDQRGQRQRQQQQQRRPQQQQSPLVRQEVQSPPMTWNNPQINLVQQQSINQSASYSIGSQLYTPSFVEYLPLEQTSLESPTVEDEIPNSNRF